MKKVEKVKHLYQKNGLINPELLKKPVIIWGCGNDGRKLYKILRSQKAEIFAFCDSNYDLYDKHISDCPVISCEEALQKDDINLALAFHQWIRVINNIKIRASREIFADFLYEENSRGGAKCIVCNSQECTNSRAHFAPFLVERMFSGENIKTKLVHCKSCDFWFSQYRPNDLEMEKLYSGYRDKKYVKQRQKYEPQYSLQPYIDADHEKRRKEKLAFFLKNKINYKSVHMLLDYGGDEGQYIPDLFDGAEKYVFEISGNKVRDGVVLLNDIEEVKNKTFDFIMCCQVLEHVSDPMKIIENMVNSLKNDGYLYIEVPNEVFFKAYSNVEINEHINFFFEDTMVFIAKKMELNLINIEIREVCRALFKSK